MLRDSLGHARKVNHPDEFMGATRLCLDSDWELKSPLKIQVGSSIRTAVQAMSPAAHGCRALSSISSSQEGRPEEGVVTMETSLILYSAAPSVPTMCWFPACLAKHWLLLAPLGYRKV